MADESAPPNPVKQAVAKESRGRAAQAVAADEGAAAKGSWLSWFAGWVLIPGALLGAVFGAGVVVGAHFSTSWVARSVMWIGSLF